MDIQAGTGTPIYVLKLKTFKFGSVGRRPPGWLAKTVGTAIHTSL